jgi:site-specific DNA-cytosine methylase
VDIGASLTFMSATLNISPTLKASRSNYFVTSLNRKLSPKEALLLQGFPKNFKIVVNNNHIYKQIGNSMSINVLYYLFKEIFKSTKLT